MLLQQNHLNFYMSDNVICAFIENYSSLYITVSFIVGAESPLLCLQTSLSLMLSLSRAHKKPTKALYFPVAAGKLLYIKTVFQRR